MNAAIRTLCAACVASFAAVYAVDAQPAITVPHELGHALGLRQTDDFADSMYSFRRPDGNDDIGSSAASGLSPHDLAAARELYAR